MERGGSRLVRLITLSLALVFAFALPASTCVAAGSSKAVGLDSSKTARPVTVWAVGDGDAGPASVGVANLIGAGGPDRVLYLGDVYEDGTAADFANNYAPTFGRFARITAPTPGNHEWPLHAVGYDAYWWSVLGRKIPVSYGFSIGGWRILSLNSEAPHGEGSPQLRWLRSQVKRPGTCRLAYWHRPRYSGGGNGDQPDVDPLWKVLRKRATIVVNGHDHMMQRLKPKDGITALIAGAGGHERNNAWADSRLAFSNDTDYGALRLRLAPGSASYRFVASDGRTLDSGRVKCKALKKRA
jgi:calcineurin-like phosphoesterase family protein